MESKNIKDLTKTQRLRAIQDDIDLNDHRFHRIDKIIKSYEETIVSMLDEKYISSTRKADKVADKIAAFGGSWKFIITMMIFLSFWIIWNLLPFTPHFDDVPFILLNLMLSFTAAFQAPIIMMSQNRQAAREKAESLVDFSINYKAEQEIDDIQDKLYEITSELNDIRFLLKELKEEQKKMISSQHIK